MRRLVSPCSDNSARKEKKKNIRGGKYESIDFVISYIYRYIYHLFIYFFPFRIYKYILSGFIQIRLKEIYTNIYITCECAAVLTLRADGEINTGRW